MTSPDYSEGVPRKVVLERKPAASVVADSDIRVGDLACSAVDCQWASTNPALQGDGCPDDDCPGVFVPILDDPEPEPAPVEGAVERVSLFLDEWGAESVQPINATPSLDLMPADLRAVLDELERAKGERDEARDFIRDAFEAHWESGSFEGLTEFGEDREIVVAVPGGFDPAIHNDISCSAEPGDPIYMLSWLSPKGGEPAT